MKRDFLGKKDPDKVMLEDVFGVNDGIVFTTPLDEQGRINTVFVESAPLIANFLSKIFSELTNRSISSGRWCGIIPEDELIVLTYDRFGRMSEKNLEILTQVLYMDMARICNLKLSNYSCVSVFCKNMRALSTFVALPENVPNGTRELPSILVPKVFVS